MPEWTSLSSTRKRKYINIIFLYLLPYSTHSPITHWNGSISSSETRSYSSCAWQLIQCLVNRGDPINTCCWVLLTLIMCGRGKEKRKQLKVDIKTKQTSLKCLVQITSGFIVPLPQWGSALKQWLMGRQREDSKSWNLNNLRGAGDNCKHTWGEVWGWGGGAGLGQVHLHSATSAPGAKLFLSSQPSLRWAQLQWIQNFVRVAHMWKCWVISSLSEFSLLKKKKLKNQSQ